MRTHGWSGAAPASDDEAIARILDAASKAIDVKGADFSITDVARTLGVTRQTVYRYFPSTDALLVAAAVRAAGDFLDRMATHLQGITDPVDAVAEAIATALEWLPKDKHLGLLIEPGRLNPHTESVTSDIAQDFAHSMIAPVRRRLGRPRLHRCRPRRARRAPAADHPVVRHRPRSAAAARRGTARLPETVGRLSGESGRALTVRTPDARFGESRQTDPTARRMSSARRIQSGVPPSGARTISAVGATSV